MEQRPLPEAIPETEAIEPRLEVVPADPVEVIEEVEEVEWVCPPALLREEAVA